MYCSGVQKKMSSDNIGLSGGFVVQTGRQIRVEHAMLAQGFSVRDSR